MRVSVSVLGVLGAALTFASLLLPWLEVDVFDYSWERPLWEFDYYLASTNDLERFAYSTALYIMVIGLAVSIWSLLGGFITLAGACTFALGGILGEIDGVAFGSSELTGATVSPGVGLYVAFTAALAMIIATVYPIEAGVGKGASRPKYRTWHVSRK
ncbi:MAG: hypothetical protein QG582_1245 [Candidatus Thermoplasmatota archaeon]|nr:hypothetical protein [Candidatus Thermoplasmatota archaeon]